MCDLLMGQVFILARVGDIERLIILLIQNTSIRINLNNLILGSLLRKRVVMPRFLNNQQLGFKLTIGGGVKRFLIAFKTSYNRLKVQIFIVSGFCLAFFLRLSWRINKRSRINFVV